MQVSFWQVTCLACLGLCLLLDVFSFCLLNNTSYFLVYSNFCPMLISDDHWWSCKLFVTRVIYIISVIILDESYLTSFFYVKLGVKVGIGFLIFVDSISDFLEIFSNQNLNDIYIYIQFRRFFSEKLLFGMMFLS